MAWHFASPTALLWALLSSWAGLTAVLGKDTANQGLYSGPLAQQRGLESLLQLAPGQIPSAYPWDQAHTFYQVSASWDALMQLLGGRINASELASSQGTCREAALAMYKEPFHHSLLWRNHTAGRPYPGEMPRTLWRWPRRITRDEFDAVREHRNFAGPAQIRWLAMYKLYGGRLYRADAGAPLSGTQHVEEMLLVVAYLYNLPNMDFIVSTADNPYWDIPVLQYAVRAEQPAWGFTYPYAPSMWPGAITALQSAAWAECLQARYPAATRLRRARWRGSTTDPSGPLTLANALGKARVQLHALGILHSDVLDTKVSRVVQVVGEGNPRSKREVQRVTHALEELLGAAESPLTFEEFQEAAVVVDVDGNSFSSRFHQLAQHSGPLLKQASNEPGYFEHLLAPGISINQFMHNLTDLPARAAEVLRDAVNPQGTQQHKARNMRAVAAITLNKWAMLEALAYSMARYSELLSWRTRPPEHESLAYKQVPWTACCRGGNLPEQLVGAIRSLEEDEAEARGWVQLWAAPVGGALRNALPLVSGLALMCSAGLAWSAAVAGLTRLGRKRQDHRA